MPVALDDSDIVRVVNTADAPFTIMYDSKSYKLEPGQDSFIPFPAAALWFGDPRSTGTLGSVVNERGLRSYIPDRDTEVRRLRVKYDNQFGDENKIIRHPLVEVYALTGERITTVLDDPAGDSVNVVPQTVQDQGNLMALITAQAQQIEKLTQLVMERDQQPAGDGAENEQNNQLPSAEDLSAALAGNETPPNNAVDLTQLDPSVPPTDQVEQDPATIQSNDALPPQSPA